MLPLDDADEAMKKVEEIRLKFEEDKYEIEILIQDINKEISEQNSEKKRAISKYFLI